LLKQDHATTPELHVAQRSDGSQVKAVGVTIHWLRKKLAPHGIEIVNIYGLGYRLAKGDRDRTRKILADYGADIVSAVTPLPAKPSETERPNT
jgi:hypothetical protein